MPTKTKQQYKDDLLRAFGKVPYNDLNENDKKEYDKLMAPFKNTKMTYEEMYQAAVDENTKELEEKRNATSNVDSQDDIDIEINEITIDTMAKFKKYSNVYEKYQIETEAIKNGLKMYANAKQAYGELKWYQKIAAHFRSAESYEPARKLRELNACKEVIDECGLKKSEVEAYTDKIIKENTIVDEAGHKEYTPQKYLEDYNDIQNQIVFEVDDEYRDQTEEFIEQLGGDSSIEPHYEPKSSDFEKNTDEPNMELGDNFQA